jgi:HEAT repeat protein
VEAAVALGKIGDAAAVPELVRQLANPTSPARFEIIEALGRLEDDRGAEALRLELCSERPEIRAAAARALGRLAYDRSGTLDALRFDYYADVRRAAEEALGTPGRAGVGAR